MSLGDAFPESYKDGFAQQNLTIGTVLKFFVKDTTPAKVKRLIIVGFSKDRTSLATIYINSPSANIYPSARRNQLLFLEALNRDYLDWDSFVDCSNLKIKNYNEVFLIVKNRQEAVLGKISEQDLSAIRTLIIKSSTISPKNKKEYGFIIH
jgi:hypothetical protein